MNKFNKIAPIFLLVGVLLAAGLRFFQYVSIMDYDTGFFTRNGETAGLLIYILMAIVAVVYVILLFADKKGGAAAFTVSTDGMGSHATQVIGIAELISAFIIVWGLISPSDITTLRMICSGGIALILLVSGFLMLKNTVPPTVTGHIKLAAAAVTYFLIAELYESDLILMRRSDKLIVMLSYLLTGAFFASSARAFSRLETVHSRMRELITSGLTFIICAVHTVPKILAYAFGGSAVTGMSGIDAVTAAGMLLSGAFIGTIYFTAKTKDIIPVVYEEEEKEKKKKDDEE